MYLCHHFISNLYNYSFFKGVCVDGDVRLVGGTNPREGRVEVCYFNQWGTICDDFWGTADARVACRQLGFSGTSKNHNLKH